MIRALPARDKNARQFYSDSGNWPHAKWMDSISGTQDRTEHDRADIHPEVSSPLGV